MQQPSWPELCSASAEEQFGLRLSHRRPCAGGSVQVVTLIGQTLRDEDRVLELMAARIEAKERAAYEDADEARKLIEAMGFKVEDDIVQSAHGKKEVLSTGMETEYYEQRKKCKADAMAEKTREMQKRQRIDQLGREDVDEVARSRAQKNRKVQTQKKKQKHRFRAFAEWLDENLQLNKWKQCKVLDVAGGNGSLAWELLLEGARSLAVTVVDPHHICLSRHKSLELSEKAKAAQGAGLFASPTIKGQVESSENQIKLHHSAKLTEGEEDMARKYFSYRGGRQMKTLFNKEFCDNDIDQVWSTANLVLGLHPDQATDEIVENALRCNKPFVVVPCCVFPKEFPHRMLDDKQVRSREELCSYLARKHPKIQCRVVESIPGPCNTVLWWAPEGHTPCAPSE